MQTEVEASMFLLHIPQEVEASMFLLQLHGTQLLVASVHRPQQVEASMFLLQLHGPQQVVISLLLVLQEQDPLRRLQIGIYLILIGWWQHRFTTSFLLPEHSTTNKFLVATCLAATVHPSVMQKHL